MLNERKHEDRKVATPSPPVRKLRATWNEARAQGLQLAVAAAGGGLFTLMGVPASWLSGAVLGVLLLVVLKRARALPDKAVDLVMLLGGASMGAGASPEALATITRYPLSLALLVAAMAASTAASVALLRRRPGWTTDEAILACVPGALSTVLAVAADRRVRLGPIAVVQMVRLMAIVLLLPSLVNAIGGTGPDILVTAKAMPLVSLAAILVLGYGLGVLLRKAGIAGAMLLGAMIVSIAGHASQTVEGGVPAPLGIATLVILGIFIGTRIRTLNRQQVRAVLPDAILVFLTGLAVACAFAAAAAYLLSVNLDTAIVAFAPGGFEAMTILALVLGLDPLYVGAHHLVRFLLVGLSLPLVMRSRTAAPPED